jgi:iron complex transport system substrate-binding protein
MLTKALAGAAMVTAAVAAAVTGAAENHERIIALNPSIVETVYELGGQGRLVGISSYSDYPAGAKREKATIGGIVNLDIERIISLNPDLILSNPSVAAGEKLSALEIPMEFLPDETLADIEKSFDRIGELVGRDDEGRALAEKLRGAVVAAQERSEGVAKVRVLAVIGYEPLWVAGGAGYLNELIEAAGGENVAGGIAKDFYAIDFERVLAEPPEVIVDLTLEGAPSEARRAVVLSFWERFKTIPAVANNRIAFVESDLLTIPGPRLVKGLEALEGALRPVRTAAETKGTEGSQ